MRRALAVLCWASPLAGKDPLEPSVDYLPRRILRLIASCDSHMLWNPPCWLLSTLNSLCLQLSGSNLTAVACWLAVALYTSFLV